MPAGYKPPKKEINTLAQRDDLGYKDYSQRQLRTDDIQGAQSKQYGYNLPANNIAGKVSGNQKQGN